MSQISQLHSDIINQILVHLKTPSRTSVNREHRQKPRIINKSGLRSYSLISHAWFAECRTHLWRNITAPSTTTSLKNLQNLTHNSGDVFGNIRTLTFRGPTLRGWTALEDNIRSMNGFIRWLAEHQTDGESEEVVAREFFGAVNEVVFSRVRFFNINHDEDEPLPLQQYVQSQGRRCSITRLLPPDSSTRIYKDSQFILNRWFAEQLTSMSLSRVEFVSLDELRGFVGTFVNLEGLHVGLITFMTDTEPSETTPAVPLLSRLRSLEFILKFPPKNVQVRFSWLIDLFVPSPNLQALTVSTDMLCSASSIGSLVRLMDSSERGIRDVSILWLCHWDETGLPKLNKAWPTYKGWYTFLKTLPPGIERLALDIGNPLSILSGIFVDGKRQEPVIFPSLTVLDLSFSNFGTSTSPDVDLSLVEEAIRKSFPNIVKLEILIALEATVEETKEAYHRGNGEDRETPPYGTALRARLDAELERIRNGMKWCESKGCLDFKVYVYRKY
ncbi:hypothetical protein PM082_009760 [Marasmius tenuissimus]|nr:hypothetical protein PM082_009760 [Marasmius tenuissimus]